MQFTSTTPLPKPYYYALALAEPAGMIAAGIYAMAFPHRFFDWYLQTRDSGLIGQAGGGPSGGLVAGGMGSCMTIIGLLSALTLPALQTVLKDHPRAHERILNRYFAAFSAGDVIHILVTLALTPAHVRSAPFTHWTVLLWGNIAGTALPAIIRLFWFAGVGRPSSKDLGKALKGKARDDGYQSTSVSDRR